MKTTHWTLIAGVLAFASLLIAFKAGWLTRGPALVLGLVCWAILRWIGIRNSKATKLRRQQELEDLKRKPILHLDD
jgi:hypothetical protein